MKWHLNTERPDEDRKIEFVVKGLMEVWIGVWKEGIIRTPDLDYVWGIVLYWRYVE
jgi:hypothetical protein